MLAGVLGLAGIKLLHLPGADTIVLVALSAGLLVLLLFIGRQGWVALSARGTRRVPPID
jgi:hypothetical protein